MSQLPTSVAVAATMTDDGPVGMVVGTFCSISLDPPLVGFFGDTASGTFPTLRGASSVAFSVLSDHARSVCAAFSRPIAERFVKVQWHLSERGNPVIDDAALTVEGTTHAVTSIGDHDLVSVHVDDVRMHPAYRPMIFHGRQLLGLDPHRLNGTLARLAWTD
ncbi:flavin reductase [Epidermidibacterium keratini]|uniref:Flavin reductase n=1 Tax=Epidermidibacterium keratini TaxID=1891644 RepID=A0A7L4YP48_9ACTN|nr:flavin reductase family protein [Epidermidibacterium keratini]QHC00848.1 flavin reductase [Epidermidibacterium keratini]